MGTGPWQATKSQALCGLAEYCTTEQPQEAGLPCAWLEDPLLSPQPTGGFSGNLFISAVWSGIH